MTLRELFARCAIYLRTLLFRVRHPHHLGDADSEELLLGPEAHEMQVLRWRQYQRL